MSRSTGYANKASQVCFWAGPERLLYCMAVVTIAGLSTLMEIKGDIEWLEKVLAFK